MVRAVTGNSIKDKEVDILEPPQCYSNQKLYSIWKYKKRWIYEIRNKKGYCHEPGQPA